ncbi:hypothetical protein CCHR01_16516 [Colletotrichum chrysophilum]|uniref:Uncharacterized protein n=1 Tax=Colletotrichum chrysophilum TaxID=1836956 RepID=A0AAD9A4B3_9PEZI|nr:hypothetical protein CCHR01_16516 [Colletotrichum chrysophilum]
MLSCNWLRPKEFSPNFLVARMPATVDCGCAMNCHLGLRRRRTHLQNFLDPLKASQSSFDHQLSHQTQIREQSRCLPSSIPMRSRSFTSVPPEVRLAPPPPWPPRLVPSVCLPRRLVRTLRRPLATGYERTPLPLPLPSRDRVVERAALTATIIEGSPRHGEAHHPKPSSRRLRRPHRLLPHHPRPQGAPPRPQEGEEHQAQQVRRPRRDHRDCANHALQVLLEGPGGHCQGDPGYGIQRRMPGRRQAPSGHHRCHPVWRDRQ